MKKESTKQKPPDEGNGVQVEDIDHEVVVTNTDDQIKQELAKFNLADSAIAAMKEKYGNLVIQGPGDKDGYKAVKTAWTEVRSKRTGLEKKGLELRNRYKVVTTAISKEEDRLIDLVSPLEDDLYKKWKAIDDEKERAEKERKDAEEKMLLSRIEDLVGLGMAFKDGFYVIGDTISMDVATLRALPDEQYKKLRGAVENKAVELKKIADDQAAERRRQQEQLKQEQEELRRQQQELRQQQEELRQQQEEISRQKQLAEQERRWAMVNKLKGLGMDVVLGNFVFDDGFSRIEMPTGNFFAMDDATFTERVDALDKLIKDKKDLKARYDEDVRLKEEAEKKKTGPDKQKFYNIITDLEVFADKIDPTAFKSKIYERKATNLLNRLTDILKEFK